MLFGTGIYFHQALLQAPNDSNDLPQAFANRSAALFQLNAFSQCIQDVDNAIKFGYSKNQLPTIILRKALSLKALGKEEEAKIVLDSIQLNGMSDQVNGDHGNGETHGSDYRKSLESTFESFSLKATESPKSKFSGHLSDVKKVNSKLQSATEALKLVHSDSKGFHMIATRKIARDEALIVEKPYCSVLNLPSYEDFCNYCCQDLDKRLFPCSSCSKVSYCSESCANQAWEEYHEKECSYLEVLHSSGILRLSLRAVIKAGIEKVLEVEKEPRGQQNLEKMRRGCDYKSMFGLSDHSKELNYLICSRQTLAACFLTYVMASYMKLIKSNDPNYYKVGGVILKHIHQISINSVAIFHQPIVPGPDNMFGVDVKNQVVATGVFPTVSLMNHSCVSNTESFFKGNKIFIRSNRAIEANEEVFYSYGPMYKKMTRGERIETLQNQYYFKCTCPACNDEIIDDIENLKSVRPVLTEAFLCGECQGPHVINGTDSKCLKCGSTSNSVSKILDQVETSKKMANIGKALLQFGRTSESEKQYLRALAILNKVCWPTNRLILSIYNELLYCAIYMDNLENALKYCFESTRIKKISYGEQSVEHIQGQLQIFNLKWTLHKKQDQNNSKTRTNSINKKLVSKLCQESEILIKNVKETILNNERSGELLILDSALVSCLKELVELEKHIRTSK